LGVGLRGIWFPPSWHFGFFLVFHNSCSFPPPPTQFLLCPPKTKNPTWILFSQGWVFPRFFWRGGWLYFFVCRGVFLENQKHSGPFLARGFGKRVFFPPVLTNKLLLSKPPSPPPPQKRSNQDWPIVFFFLEPAGYTGPPSPFFFFPPTFAFQIRDVRAVLYPQGSKCSFLFFGFPKHGPGLLSLNPTTFPAFFLFDLFDH